MINADVPERNCTAGEGMNLDILPIVSATASTWVLCFQGNEAGPRQTNCHSLTLLVKAHTLITGSHTRTKQRLHEKHTTLSLRSVRPCVAPPSGGSTSVTDAALPVPDDYPLFYSPSTIYHHTSNPKSSVFSSACLCSDDTDVCDSCSEQFWWVFVMASHWCHCARMRALTCLCWRCPLELRGVTRSRYPLTSLVAWLQVSLRELWPSSLTCRSLGPTTRTWTSMGTEKSNLQNRWLSWCIIKVFYREIHSILITIFKFPQTV